jgi:hypothetical protein
MNQITLRKVPENIYKQLGQIAKKKKTSINKTIIYLLKKSLGIDEETNRKRDLSDLSGTWSNEQAKEFNSKIKIFEKIDNEVWE